jgi:DUF2075 family protein
LITGAAAPDEPWGWAGTVRKFLGVTPEKWLASLGEHHRRMFGQPPSHTQTDAWAEEYEVLSAALRVVCVARPDAVRWGVVFEYELPLEGGRRPDVVLLAGGAIAVLEFKSAPRLNRGFVDQVAAYARDLAEYHEVSHGRPIHPILVLTRGKYEPRIDQGVSVIDIALLSSSLQNVAAEDQIDLMAWLNSDYKPLPFLIEAARRIFANEPLPHVKRALSAGIPQAVDLLCKIAQDAASNGLRMLVMLTGVPGSGKTLTGLRLVYEHSAQLGSSTFLSGNGPLVQVLQDALGNRAFVRDLHAYIRSYGIGRRKPKEHVVVFDEAQRAWDRDYMQEKRGVPKGEPQLLIEAGEKVEAWVALVGLVGDGQEIHSGEEGGISQWAEAVRPPIASENWKIHCAPRLAADFAGSSPVTHKELDLSLSLRSRRAEQLHAWVQNLLDGSLPFAARLALPMHDEGFPMYLTRDLNEAKRYVRARYEGDTDKRYGLLSSSHARSLPKFGIDNSWPATSRLKVARWYNDPPSKDSSCCALEATVTEFSCQGLELDLPLVCWGEDYAWTGSEWRLTPIRRRYAQVDPKQLLKNVYRVLLTRGRDGLVIFIPPTPALDQTEVALLAAGIRPVPGEEQVAAFA